MSLPALSDIPRTPEQWMQWSFDHRDSHDRIRAAIRSKFGLSLTDYQIEPISPSATRDFLQRHSQLHIEANGALGLQSTDLQDVNLSDERELISWIDANRQEHFDLEMKLGI